VISSFRIFDVFHDKRVEMLRTGIYSTKYSEGMMWIQTLQSGTFIVSEQGQRPFVYTTKIRPKETRVCGIHLLGGREGQTCVLAVGDGMTLTGQNKCFRL
jgi:hypothetical protein